MYTAVSSRLLYVITRCLRVKMCPQMLVIHWKLFKALLWYVFLQLFADIRERHWSHSQKLQSMYVNWGYGHFHSTPDRSPWVFVQQAPPTPHHQLPHIHHDIHTNVHTLSNPWICHATPCLSLIEYRCYQGTHAARSGGGWITLFALRGALVTYFSLKLLQLEEEQDREGESDGAPDNAMFQIG